MDRQVINVGNSDEYSLFRKVTKLRQMIQDVYVWEDER